MFADNPTLKPAPLTRRHRSALRALDARCGTEDGYRQHLAEGDLPCGDCNTAHDQHLATQRAAAADHSNYLRTRHCGTNKGWDLHRRLRTTPCPPCQQARDEYVAAQCGTTRGYSLHRRYKTTICPACRRARADYLATWQAANPEKCQTYQKTYYDGHREQRIAYSANYRRARTAAA